LVTRNGSVSLGSSRNAIFIGLLEDDILIQTMRHTNQFELDA